ncbi:gamma-type small acid-soluble spore protein [Bacillus songklensis]|uniref:Gamma-type small acid-soluble spore protein n=1 Tax=Bacillus songklensis TaxID=1069116 RepID=A0ABV8B2M2_9BACI
MVTNQQPKKTEAGANVYKVEQQGGAFTPNDFGTEFASEETVTQRLNAQEAAKKGQNAGQ